jgi:hypothetical protein
VAHAAGLRHCPAWQERRPAVVEGAGDDSHRHADPRAEPHLHLLDCFDARSSDCPLTSACRLKKALQRAHAAFFAVLDEYTLADLLGNSSTLVQLLGRRPR